MSRFLLRPAVPALLAVAALALTGCSGDGDGGGEPAELPLGSGSAAPAAPASTAPATPAGATAAPGTGTARSPIRWLGPAATGAAAAVQQATRDYWSMVVRLAEEPDPDDPALTELSLPPQRTTLVTVYTSTREQGIAQRGPIDGSVTAAGVAGSTATARTCLDQTLVRVYDRAGRARPGSSGARTLFTVSLRRDGDAWKVSAVTGRDGACTLPS